MAHPVVIQTSTEQSGAGTVTLSLTGVTAGSTIAIIIWQGTASNRQYVAASYLLGAQTNNATSIRQSTIL